MHIETALRALIDAFAQYDINPSDIKLVGKDRNSDYKLQCAIKHALSHHAIVYTNAESETKFCDLQIGEYKVRPLTE